jgi:acyl-CoA synthetase (AMP-forming)/AMP-acid ligase II
VDEQGRDLPSNEPGEIIVQGPNIFAGYWRKGGTIVSALKNNWFHTGDMGMRDEDGFVYIVGRKVEMIISSGENIYPAEVERVIQSLPQVKEAAVVGMPNEKRGEVAAAFVILKKEQNLSENELTSFLAEKIAYYKIPKKIIFVEDFPRNQSGKVLKRILKKRLEEILS